MRNNTELALLIAHGAAAASGFLSLRVEAYDDGAYDGAIVYLDGEGDRFVAIYVNDDEDDAPAWLVQPIVLGATSFYADPVPMVAENLASSIRWLANGGAR